MTQEQKELLLKDLCARLPYGVKVNNEIQGDFNIYGICENFVFGRNEVCHIDFDVEKIKPYLFPLSSMTEKQMEELNRLCTMYIPERFNFDDYHPYAYKGIKVLYKHVDGDYKFDFKIDVIDWFNKNHFDYRGFIEKGLAIDATNLNIY